MINGWYTLYVISYSFYVEFTQEPMKLHIPQLWSCDVGLFIIGEYYEIMCVVVELF